ncbi:MAG TPA: hypothetical protein PK299_01490 [Anaerolineales bacterium]|nr:hypothetical protein [Anaerolineales bacterium]
MNITHSACYVRILPPVEFYLNPRIKLAVVVSCIVSLLFALTQHFINQLILWGIPIASSDWRTSLFRFGWTVFAWMVVGIICGIPNSWYKGALFAALVTTGFLFAFDIIQQSQTTVTWISLLVIKVVLFMPAVALMLLPFSIFRALLNWYRQQQFQGAGWQVQVAFFVGVALVGVLVGATTRLSTSEEHAVRSLNRLVLDAMQAKRLNQVPFTLRSSGIFPMAEAQPYWIEWGDHVRSEEIIDGQSGGAMFYFPLRVYFADGTTLDCLAGDFLPNPVCAGEGPKILPSFDHNFDG